MIFIDVESVGLFGVPVLIQHAEDEGDVQLFSIWLNPISETLALIEKFCNHEDGLVFFNAAFDFFMLCKIYTIFDLYPDKDAIPEDIIDKLAELEMAARDGPCLKPIKVHDVFLHARKTAYQSTMERSDIRIRRVPTSLAWQLAAELERRVPLKDIYFARKKNKNATKWNVYDIETEDGINLDFKDVVLKFAASSALKALAFDALGIDPSEILRFGDVSVDETWYPKEYGYAPFAKAAGGNSFDWKGAWPEKIRHHITHWAYHEIARKYAADDVKYTRSLYKFFGSPPLGDDDSELACMVAAVRWRGFKIDIPKLKAMKEKAIKKIGEVPTSRGPVQHYVLSHLDETEKLVIKGKFRENPGSTKKTILETIVKLTRLCTCNANGKMDFNPIKINAELVEDFDAPENDFEVQVTGGQKDCLKCKGTGFVPHPAAEKAREVLDARAAEKEIEIYDKLILAGRFMTSFRVIGTLSSRMTSGDGLNAQGVNKDKEVRACFPLAHDGSVLCGGDFAGFEVTLAEACYNDPDLRKDLLTCESCNGAAERIGDRIRADQFLSADAFARFRQWRAKAEAKAEAKIGITYVKKTEEEIANESFENDFICTSCGSNKGKKIHALFGVHVFPEMTYEQIKATDGTENDIYTKCKQAVFAMFYGGEGPTLQDRLGVDLETANKAFERFAKKYRQVGFARRKIFDMFCSMRQQGGIGTKVQWHEPHEYVESMFGFRRYFTLENNICRALFNLAESPPKSWRDIKIRVIRRDRVQMAEGATRSALFGAAFALQASNMRAAANHVIQSSGAQITKATQRAIWEIQPSGVHPWLVQCMNIHDEIQAVCDPSVVERVEAVVKAKVETFRPTVPLIKIEWSKNMKTWADK